MRTLAPVLLAAALPAGAQVTTVVPAAADPCVSHFDEPSIAVAGPAGAPLAVCLTGTGGRPRGASGIIGAIARQGNPVPALAYDDDPACSAQVREMRAIGTGASRTVGNPPAEGIVARLAAEHVLVFSLDLRADHPAGAAAQNPYHGITIRDPRYAAQWATMFGTPAGAAP